MIPPGSCFGVLLGMAKKLKDNHTEKSIEDHVGPAFEHAGIEIAVLWGILEKREARQTAENLNNEARQDEPKEE